jgi:hypothetical protein
LGAPRATCPDQDDAEGEAIDGERRYEWYGSAAAVGYLASAVRSPVEKLDAGPRTGEQAPTVDEVCRHRSVASRRGLATGLLRLFQPRSQQGYHFLLRRHNYTQHILRILKNNYYVTLKKIIVNY